MLRLRKVLDIKGIKVKGFAETIGMSEKTMYNKLMEESEFSYGEARKIKAVLPEYDIDYLLSPDSSMSVGA